MLILTLISGSIAVASSKNSTESLLRESSRTEAKTPKNLKKSPATIEEYYSSELDKLGVRLAPGVTHRADSKSTTVTERRCRSRVYQTLMGIPSFHREELSQLTLFYTKDGRRGLGGGGEVVLRCLNVTDTELAGVLIHEMGHLVDAGYLTGNDVSSPSGFYDFDDPVALNDASLNFYKISWTSETARLKESSELDFVSLYAMTDPFEDFAETYTFYRLHGAEFRTLALTNAELNSKYEFMKNSVFLGTEYGVDATAPKVDIWQRNYDVTVLPFPKEELFSNA